MEGCGKFPKSRRLSRKRDFDAVFAKGASTADANLVVYALPNALGYPRLGMAVGKQHGKAVMRNRIKRLIREAFRLNGEKLPGSADIVVIPRNSLQARLTDIETSLVELANTAAKQAVPADREESRN